MAGAQVDRIALLLLAVSVGMAACVVFVRWPRYAVLTWLLVLAFVPVWLGVNVIFYWLPGVVLGGIAAAVLVRPNRLRLGVADGLVMAFLAACVLPFLLPGALSPTAIFTVLTQWFLAVLIGRSAPGRIPLVWVYQCVGLVFVAVAGLALVEFLFSWNPFVLLPGDAKQLEVWGALQERGTVVRAEGAWGHSIAMGCAVALSMPIWLAAKFPVPIRLFGLAVMFAGVAVSFSRAAMLTAVLATLLSLWGLREELSAGVKVLVAAVLAALAAVFAPIITEAYVTGQETAARSATYRGDLLELIPDIQWIGLAENAYRAPSGETYFRGFQSIDNALLLLGLNYGWIALGLALVLIAAAVVTTLRRRAAPPTLAVVAMIPALTSVALITQLGMYLWFVIGLALAAQSQDRSAAVRDDRVSDMPTTAPAALAEGGTRPAVLERV